MSLLTYINRKIFRKQRDIWNYQYAQGRWNDLGEINELSRFSVIVGYAQFLKPNARILELGAGKGYLQQRFDYSKYSLYYSTDVSVVAIDEAKHREDDKTKFLVADMETYIPDTTFDCIIINEAIYYAQSAKAVLDHFSPYLAPDGIFIISLHESEHNEKWFTMVDECGYPQLNRTVVHCTPNRFHVVVLKKPN